GAPWPQRCPALAARTSGLLQELGARAHPLPGRAKRGRQAFERQTSAAPRGRPRGNCGKEHCGKENWAKGMLRTRAVSGRPAIAGGPPRPAHPLEERCKRPLPAVGDEEPLLHGSLLLGPLLLGPLLLGPLLLDPLLLGPLLLGPLLLGSLLLARHLMARLL